MSSGLCGCVFSFLACGVRVSDVTAVSGPGWGSRVWRRTLWSAWMCWKGPESPSGPDAPWRRASDWLSWRLWCRCWRSMSVTLWMLSDGIFIRWGEQRALLTHSTAVCICFISILTGCLYFYSSMTSGHLLQHCLWSDSLVQIVIFIVFILYLFFNQPRFETVVSELILVKNEALHAINNLRKWMQPQHVERNLVGLFCVLQSFTNIFIILLGLLWGIKQPFLGENIPSGCYKELHCAAKAD